ncbi:hypothetical protein L3556_06305 [Candidatus Synechococcus calcipolaris G9]|uniref:Uncharacterized protein n=1 Tax=Candidatus Synechococcus calcipolaris G9 TaxID=1497997 RepID=A0ABT6EYP9_9SYNE|nr:hypothetical protein [Candidatus Synechococcus calcipolaris]MDG2990547.1 hypothetical protein [Candidatus Synechococcus calcipolaris G9]
MKYFFLADGWEIGRIWEPEGIWNDQVWRRRPDIARTSLSIWDGQETLWLYQVEDIVLMVEVKPALDRAQQAKNDLPQNQGSAVGIGQVVLKRLMTADQVLAYLISMGTCVKKPV